MVDPKRFAVSRRIVLAGIATAASSLIAFEAKADDTNTYEEDVPAGIGIASYTVRRDRAERSFVTLEYFDYYAGRWIVDNVQDPPERKNIDNPVAFTRPAAFQPSTRPLKVRVSGVWMPDNSQHNPMERVEAAQFKDRVEVFMFARHDDPNATAIARLIYTQDIPLP